MWYLEKVMEGTYRSLPGSPSSEPSTSELTEPQVPPEIGPIPSPLPPIPPRRKRRPHKGPVGAPLIHLDDENCYKKRIDELPAMPLKSALKRDHTSKNVVQGTWEKRSILKKQSPEEEELQDMFGRLRLEKKTVRFAVENDYKKADTWDRRPDYKRWESRSLEERQTIQDAMREYRLNEMDIHPESRRLLLLPKRTPRKSKSKSKSK
ncbi:unnamed protein product [Ceutorhynchus assimilis]|uniref:Uncharacterized protein n=1 Tax=Ceutorhynchus assimilis TaxID=467358 RepID=A0A9P0DH46_9CUCU|nr:unnamed protein product [Ceutorhynchus assimilis]